ncbi:hypothetical protein WJX77_006103 [Trebouxia sp. C0004]
MGCPMDCKQVAMEPEKIAPEMKSIIKLVKQDGVEKRPNRTSNYADLNIAILESAATKKPAKVPNLHPSSWICGLHWWCSVVNGTKAPAGPLTCRCAAVQVDPNLSKSERPIEAVRRGKWGCGM